MCFAHVYTCCIVCMCMHVCEHMLCALDMCVHVCALHSWTCAVHVLCMCVLCAQVLCVCMCMCVLCACVCVCRVAHACMCTSVCICVCVLDLAHKRLRREQGQELCDQAWVPAPSVPASWTSPGPVALQALSALWSSGLSCPLSPPCAGDPRSGPFINFPEPLSWLPEGGLITTP